MCTNKSKKMQYGGVMDKIQYLKELASEKKSKKKTKMDVIFNRFDPAFYFWLWPIG